MFSVYVCMYVLFIIKNTNMLLPIAWWCWSGRYIACASCTWQQNTQKYYYKYYIEILRCMQVASRATVAVLYTETLSSRSRLVNRRLSSTMSTCTHWACTELHVRFAHSAHLHNFIEHSFAKCGFWVSLQRGGNARLHYDKGSIP